MAGDPALDRHVSVRITGLGDRPHRLRHWRIDAENNNVAARWRQLGGGADWPDDDQWRTLATSDRLAQFEPDRRVQPAGTAVDVELDLPMPAISYLELRPV
jgi:xylan 1,4-beta-xylosidase